MSADISADTSLARRTAERKEVLEPAGEGEKSLAVEPPSRDAEARLPAGKGDGRRREAAKRPPNAGLITRLRSVFTRRTS